MESKYRYLPGLVATFISLVALDVGIEYRIMAYDLSELNNKFDGNISRLDIHLRELNKFSDSLERMRKNLYPLEASNSDTGFKDKESTDK